MGLPRPHSVSTYLMAFRVAGSDSPSHIWRWSRPVGGLESMATSSKGVGGPGGCVPGEVDPKTTLAVSHHECVIGPERGPGHRSEITQ